MQNKETVTTPKTPRRWALVWKNRNNKSSPYYKVSFENFIKHIQEESYQDGLEDGENNAGF